MVAREYWHRNEGRCYGLHERDTNKVSSSCYFGGDERLFGEVNSENYDESLPALVVFQ